MKRRPESTAAAIAARIDSAPAWRRVRLPTASPSMMVASYRIPAAGYAPEIAVTAAAQVMLGRSVAQTPKRPPAQSFQKEAWELRDEIGEFRFSGDRIARSVSLLRPFAARVDDLGDAPTQVDDGPAFELCRDLFSNQAATRQAMFRSAQHLIFNGETYPVISETDNDRLTWTPCSASELTNEGSTWRFDDGATKRVLDPTTEMVLRAWIPHPQRAAYADCGARAVLPVVRELRGLTEHVSAQIDSRLAGAGILLVPQEIEVLRGQGNPAGGDDEDDLDPFVRDLMDMMLTPIKDRGSAAAVVPLVAKVPGDLVDKIKHLKLFEPLDPKAKELREEAIRRVALGMDSPPEVLLGLGSGSNHWSAWAISEEDVTLAVAPIGAVILHALTVGWLQPMLRESGVADWDRYTIWFDASALQLRPDRSKDAQNLHGLDVLSDEALLRENGFGDTDKPNPEETQRRLLIRLLLAAPNLASAILPALGIDLELPETPAGSNPTPPQPEDADPAARELPDRAEPQSQQPDAGQEATS